VTANVGSARLETPELYRVKLQLTCACYSIQRPARTWKHLQERVWNQHVGL